MLMRWWLMNVSQAATLNTIKSDATMQLEPREIDMGQYKGKFVLPYHVVQNPDYQSHWDAIMMCTDISLNTDDIFAPPEEAARGA